MRFVSDDGGFGILVARNRYLEPGARNVGSLARFQLVIGAQLIGDSEPCAPYGAFVSLRSPHRVDGPESAALPADPAALYAFLRADSRLQDATRGPSAESLDGWSIKLLATESRVLLMTREYVGDDPAGELFSSSVEHDEYFDLVAAAYEHWSLLCANVPQAS
jgi:hypothetical protein